MIWGLAIIYFVPNVKDLRAGAAGSGASPLLGGENKGDVK
jgi:hypothetical protein